MAKAGVTALTKHIACKFGSNNICTYILMLGNIAKEATYSYIIDEERCIDAQEAVMKRWRKSEEVTKVAACVASDDFSFVTGNTVVIDWGAVTS